MIEAQVAIVEKRKEGITLKKILLSTLCIIFILTGCNSSSISISKIEVVPNEVQDKINTDNKHQLIYEEENIFYIVFRSKGSVTADLEEDEDTLKIMLDEEEQQNDVDEQHVFKVSKTKKTDTINVYINGEITVFDSITSL